MTDKLYRKLRLGFGMTGEFDETYEGFAAEWETEFRSEIKALGTMTNYDSALQKSIDIWNRIDDLVKHNVWLPRVADSWKASVRDELNRCQSRLDDED